jgi:hypothetical protein
MLSSLALANAAMGLGLEMFDLRTWLVYVVATVAFEAWFIGIRSGYGVWKSMGISIGANFVTALCCPQILAPAFHNDTINPNPIFYIVEVLFWYGLVSAVFEGFIWAPGKSIFIGPWRESIKVRSIFAHMLGVPLALVILLLPPRPYVGLERTVGTWRRIEILRTVMKDLGNDIDADGRVPKLGTVEELIDKYARNHEYLGHDAWVGAYLPDYGRFDTGEARRSPLELNRSVAGMKIGEDDKHKGPTTVWVIRGRRGDYCFGYLLDVGTGELKATYSSRLLGY